MNRLIMGLAGLAIFCLGPTCSELPGIQTSNLIYNRVETRLSTSPSSPHVNESATLIATVDLTESPGTSVENYTWYVDGNYFAVTHGNQTSWTFTTEGQHNISVVVKLSNFKPFNDEAELYVDVLPEQTITQPVNEEIWRVYHCPSSSCISEFYLGAYREGEQFTGCTAITSGFSTQEEAIDALCPRIVVGVASLTFDGEGTCAAPFDAFVETCSN
jgi:hypothetical protein